MGERLQERRGADPSLEALIRRGEPLELAGHVEPPRRFWRRVAEERLDVTGVDAARAERESGRVLQVVRPDPRQPHRCSVRAKLRVS